MFAKGSGLKRLGCLGALARCISPALNNNEKTLDCDSRRDAQAISVEIKLKFYLLLSLLQTTHGGGEKMGIHNGAGDWLLFKGQRARIARRSTHRMGPTSGQKNKQAVCFFSSMVSFNHLSPRELSPVHEL